MKKLHARCLDAPMVCENPPHQAHICLVPDAGSYEVRFSDGRPSIYFYWDDNPGRRSIARNLSRESAVSPDEGQCNKKRPRPNQPGPVLVSPADIAGSRVSGIMRETFHASLLPCGAGVGVCFLA